MDFSRKLPVGIQDFEDLRTNGYLYVDKSMYIYQLTRVDWPYFLARPRRFGKSLLLSALKAFFPREERTFRRFGNCRIGKRVDRISCFPP